MSSSSLEKEKQVNTMTFGTHLSRIMLFLAFVSGAYVVETQTASAQEYRQCAGENGICRLPYPTEVLYGNGKRMTSRFINRPEVRCSNAVFGDPARGTAKSCFYVVRHDQGRDKGRDRGGYGRDNRHDEYGRNNGRHSYRPDRESGRGGQWQRCAGEGQYCNFSGRKMVRYGTQDRYVERMMRGGTPCDNRTFGDPNRGGAKSCYVLN